VNPKARSAALIGLGVLIAGALFWFWQQMSSRDARIDSLHRACMAEFAEVAARMKAGVQPGDGTSGIVKGLSESLGKVLEGMSGDVSDAVCAAVRDACRDDFDGRICTAARERYD
jgi:hypothetical protein